MALNCIFGFAATGSPNWNCLAARLSTHCCHRRLTRSRVSFSPPSAGTGKRHAFMATLADGLARRGVSVLRYHFRDMEA